MTATRTITGGVCAYCRAARAVHRDHIVSNADRRRYGIAKNQARRNLAASKQRENPRFKVPSCRNCNEGKGTRLRVPPSHADVIETLERITGGVYEVWHGDAAGLRTVVR